MSATIPVNSLARHIAPLAERLNQAARQVIGSGYFVLGPHLKKFEQAFADYCGTSHCIGVANGTDALELALKAMGVGAGDRVALAPNAAMYGTTAVLACDASPVFIDIDPVTHTISPQALEGAIAQHAPKAVIVTHLYGRLANMGALIPLARQNGMLVLEDCAQAHGAEDPQGTRAGAFGDIASFSFYPTKNLGALGDGGAIITNDKRLADRSRQLRQYGWSGKYTNELPGGRNSRLDELQAAMLLELLPELDAWNARRREIANRYSREIRNPSLRVAAEAGREYVAHLYVVETDDRDLVRSRLADAGIQTEIHYPTPDYHQPCLQGIVDVVPLQASEAAARTVMTLPCFPEMTDTEVQTVIDACNRL